MVSLLGGQFLGDIEHICLGSVSYDSDASSSATSRSVGSIVSDASRASDGSRGCRPRVTNTSTATRGYRFTFPSHLPNLVQEHLLLDSDLTSENHNLPDKGGSKVAFKGTRQGTQCILDTYDSDGVPANQSPTHTPDQPWRNDSENEPTENANQEPVFSGATSEQVKGTNTTPTENGNNSDNDLTQDKEPNDLSQYPCNGDTTEPSQNHTNQTPEPEYIGRKGSEDINHSPSHDKSSETEEETDDAPEAERDETLPMRSEGQGEDPPHSNTQEEESQEGSNSGNDSGQGKEAQNAAALTHYLQKGCGAKILVALDQLGVVVSVLLGVVMSVCSCWVLWLFVT